MLNFTSLLHLTLLLLATVSATDNPALEFTSEFSKLESPVASQPDDQERLKVDLAHAPHLDELPEGQRQSLKTKKRKKWKLLNKQSQTWKRMDRMDSGLTHLKRMGTGLLRMRSFSASNFREKISTGKVIMFIRHAQSEYNAAKSQQIKEWYKLNCLSDPMKFDAALSEKGMKSLHGLVERTRNKNIFDEYKLVVASPLDRAIHTAMAILGQCSGDGKIIQKQQIRVDNWKPDPSKSDDREDIARNWPIWLTKEQCNQRSLLVAEKKHNSLPEHQKVHVSLPDLVSKFQDCDWEVFQKSVKERKKLLLNSHDRYALHEIDKLKKLFSTDSNSSCRSVPFPTGVTFILRPECRELLDTSADIGSRREILEFLYPQLTDEHFKYVPPDEPFWTHSKGSEYKISKKETSSDGKERAQRLYSWLDHQEHSDKIIVVTHSSFISKAVHFKKRQLRKVRNCGVVKCELFRVYMHNDDQPSYVCEEIQKKKNERQSVATPSSN